MVASDQQNLILVDLKKSADFFKKKTYSDYFLLTLLSIDLFADTLHGL